MCRAGLLLLMLPALFLRAALAEPQFYKVDSHSSYIHIYTDTAGALKAFAHRHLIAIRDIEGAVYWSDNEPRAQLTLRPENFLMDDDADRKRSQDRRYQKLMAQSVKSGTRKNMLGERLLYVNKYPLIRVDIQLASPGVGSVFFDLEVTLKNNVVALQVPGVLNVTEHGLTARADFEVSHRDLRLKPYTAAAGALKVADTLRFVVDLNAVSVDSE